MTHEKTADEMFRELGYEKSNVPLVTRYVKDYSVGLKSAEEIRVYNKSGEVMKETIKDGFIVTSKFSAAEIRAVAKLLDEMGV